MSTRDEMVNWLRSDRGDNESDSAMSNLITVLDEHLRTHSYDTVEEESASVEAPIPVPSAPRQRTRSINWPRKYREYVEQVAEADRLEREEEEITRAAAELETAEIRERTAVLAAERQAELDAAKAARKSGAPVQWGNRGPSMADKLKGAWAALPANA